MLLKSNQRSQMIVDKSEIALFIHLKIKLKKKLVISFILDQYYILQ